MINLKTTFKSTLLTLFAVFNIIAIFILAYLLTLHYQTNPTCAGQLFGDCGTVNKSAFSTIMGIPVALLGILWLGGSLVVALIKLRFIDNRILTAIMLGMKTWSVLFALYLISIEAFVLQQWCQYCLLSDLFIFGSFLCALALFLIERRDAKMKAKASAELESKKSPK